jgi:uncharacterized protein (TIGR01244 family)
MLQYLFGAAIFLSLLVHAAQAQDLQKRDFPGAINYTRVSATVGCAGATTPDVIPALKREGYVSIINLRLANERGANIEGEKALAEAAGIRFLHLPLNASAPEPSIVDEFLKAVSDPKNQPVFIHCASANRVGAVWMIKRVLQDKWTVERAMTEAEAIGLSNAALKAFALEYVRSHGR